MRILALESKGLVLPFIHSSIVNAFRSLGAKVDGRAVPEDARTLPSFLDGSNGRFDAGFVLDLGNDPIFIRNFKEIQATLRIPWAIWFVDDPEGYGFPHSCDPEWTRAFCWDREISRRISPDGNWKGRPVEYLPLAGDPGMFFPDPAPSGLVHAKGVFVGSTRHKNPFLQEAARSFPGFQETEGKIWEIYSRDLTRPLPELLREYLGEAAGKSMDDVMADPLAKMWVRAFAFRIGKRKRLEVVSRLLDGGQVFGDEGWRKVLPGSYRGALNYGDEVRAAYSRSSFVLDVRQPQSRTGLTQRVFDAGCCGVPVLTEWTPELENLFDSEPGPFSFRTIQEGIEQREELLRSLPLARRRAEKIRSRILARHTFIHRARRILEALGEGA